MNIDAVPAPPQTCGTVPPVTINDVVIEIATSNGTGSQSANTVLLRSIIQMGVTASGKNLFPSNIQGLPTWFTIRASEAGWTARRRDHDFLVAMNVESVADDIKKLRPGAVLILNDELKSFLQRDDLVTCLVPFNKLLDAVCPEARLRKLVANMIYVGVVAALLSIDMAEVERAIEKQFDGKAKAIDINTKAARAGYDWTVSNGPRGSHFQIERRQFTTEKILINGNDAAAMGFLFGGVQVVGWYPITPSTDLVEYLGDYLQKYRRDPATGKASYAIIQVEDEIAAIGLVTGAGWTGARAMTSTSGPGISLMAEMCGLSYFAEVPGVICDVQRMGPSTGLPTRTSQGDILKTYYLSHGDCKHILLLPGSQREIFELAVESLNIAERFQTMVFVMTDLDLAMNNWMSDAFSMPSKPIQRGKVLTAADLERLGQFQRYADVDGDGIPYRTYPGTRHPLAAYFTRGTGHTVKATYSEDPDNWRMMLDRLSKKFETARRELPAPILTGTGTADVGIIAYGSTDVAVAEALPQLAQETRRTFDYLRVLALPAHEQVREFIAKHRVVYLVEQNRDAQMAAILRAEWPEIGAKLRSILYYDGLPIHARFITDAIIQAESVA